MPRIDALKDFANTNPEIHALAIGAVFGVLVGVTMSIEIAAFFALVIMGVQGRRAPGGVDRTHLKDASKEIAYSGGAFVVCFFAGFAVNAIAI